MRSDKHVLVIEQLRKEFKRVTALRDIDIVLDKPGVYGFLGPNGAGKSTTFKVVCGLLKPTSGRVLVGGDDVQQNPRAAVAQLGVQFDAPSFYPYLSGYDNLAVFAKWLDRGVEHARLEELLSQVGLRDASRRKVGGYSWGMKQRLGLASALLNDPKLVLLDEPTNGLDPGGIADMRRLLPKLVHEQERTIFMSSHRMEEVEQVCDYVIIIHEGSIIAQGVPAELASDDNLVEVHCDDAQAAARILGGLGDIGNVEVVAAGKIEVFAPNVKAARINQFLIEQGVTVEQVVKRRESLEQVFFRLTGAGPVDGAGAADGGEVTSREE